MIIAACIGVKDELELIEGCIVHLKDIGVDRFLVFNLFSTDGTREILAKYESNHFRVIDIGNDVSAKVFFETSKNLIKALDADWVIFVDADEFPLPKDGNLRSCRFLHDTDLATVSRFNVAVGSDGPLMPEVIHPSQYDKLWLIVEPINRFRELIFRDASIPWIRAIPQPKIVARLNRFNGFTDGAHKMIPTSGPSLRTTVPVDLITAHVPITNFPRFERKVRNIKAFLATNYDHYADAKNKAWHWKRWVDLEKSRTLEEEFRKSVWDGETLQLLRKRGILRPASDLFSAAQDKICPGCS